MSNSSNIDKIRAHFVTAPFATDIPSGGPGNLLAQVLLRLRRLPLIYVPCGCQEALTAIDSEYAFAFQHDADCRQGWYVDNGSGWPEWPISSDLVHAAAADHCLAAAYRGECPGVEPQRLMEWRIHCRAQFLRVSTDALIAVVEEARKTLSGLPLLPCAGLARCLDNLSEAPYSPIVHEIACPLSAGGGIVDCRDSFIPELPEAAARDGLSYLALLAPQDQEAQRREPRSKYFMSGTPAQVRWFLQEFPADGKYGDPARGFAGGYAK